MVGNHGNPSLRLTAGEAKYAERVEDATQLLEQSINISMSLSLYISVSLNSVQTEFTSVASQEKNCLETMMSIQQTQTNDRMRHLYVINTK